ncbi:hypothetical protein BHE74_00019725, partial [Ensete ventricosum]
PGCQICAISARGKCASAVLTTSSSFKIQGRAASALRRRASIKPDMEAEEFINLLHGSDPVRVELSRLENELSEVRMRFDAVFSSDRDGELSGGEGRDQGSEIVGGCEREGNRRGGWLISLPAKSSCEKVKYRDIFL